MVIVNYSKLSSLAKKRVREAGYTPDAGGKTASRKTSKRTRDEPTPQPMAARERQEEKPIFTGQQPQSMAPPPKTKERFQWTEGGSPARQIQRQYRRGDISIAEANRQARELKERDKVYESQAKTVREDYRKGLIDTQTRNKELERLRQSDIQATREYQATKGAKAKSWYARQNVKLTKVTKPVINKLFNLENDRLSKQAKQNPVYMQAQGAIKESIRQARDEPMKGVILGAVGSALGPVGQALNRVPGARRLFKFGVETAGVAYGGYVGAQYATAKDNEQKGKVLGRAAYEVASMELGAAASSPLTRRMQYDVLGRAEMTDPATGRELVIRRVEKYDKIIETGYEVDASGKRRPIYREVPKDVGPSFRQKASDAFDDVKNMAKDASKSFKQSRARAKEAKAEKELQKSNKGLDKWRAQERANAQPRYSLAKRQTEIDTYKQEKIKIGRKYEIGMPIREIIPKRTEYPIEPYRKGDGEIELRKTEIEPYRRRRPSDEGRPKDDGLGKEPRARDFTGDGGFGIPLVPILPGFPGGGGLFSGVGKMGLRKGRTRKAYLPSQAALAFNIRGKLPGRTTGLELRPIRK